MDLLSYRLEDITNHFVYGSMPKSEMITEKGYPIFSGYRYVGYYPKYNVANKSIIVVARGVGGTGDVKLVEGKTFLTNLSIALDINQDIANLDYLYYYLNAQGLRYLDTGAAQSQITITSLKRHKVYIPNIAIQNKIASILSAYDNLIENNNRRIRLLEQMAENLYKEWFVRFRFPGHEKAEFENGLPKGWKAEHIGDVCETLGGGTPSTTKLEYWNGDIKWVTPTDITTKNSLPLLTIEGRITEEGLKNSSAKLLPPYTILMTSRASIGYFGLAPFPVCTNQGFISIIPNMVNMRMYLLHNLMTRKDEIIMNANGATFLEISKGRFRKMKIIVPDDQTLDAFEKIDRNIFIQVLKIEKQSTLLMRQRDLLLPRLMSGKLKVNEIEKSL
jgi:type I restriction enzyme S subunit